MTLKGQNFRIYNGASVIGMATGCTVTLNSNTDDANTKDDVGMASKANRHLQVDVGSQLLMWVPC